ncbi:unnamed protein product [marine sediment metagenome]|uniref:Uncharacterized protein n=1 Tax=marine sediment metagenome TaxID=412755 RepID=X1VI15_9ZZZZ
MQKQSSGLPIGGKQYRVSGIEYIVKKGKGKKCKEKYKGCKVQDEIIDQLAD